MLLWPMMSHALDVNLYVNTRLLTIRGEIKLGDLKELAELDHKRALLISVSGPGGNMNEGLRIAQALHGDRTQGQIEVRSACVSACAAFLAANGRLPVTIRKDAFLAFHGGTAGYVFQIGDFLRSRPDLLINDSNQVNAALAVKWTEIANKAWADMHQYYGSVNLNADRMMNLLSIGQGQITDLVLKKTDSGPDQVQASGYKPETCLWYVPDAAGLRALGFTVADFAIDREAVAKKLKVKSSDVCWELPSQPK
jgi:hypothetical protein